MITRVTLKLAGAICILTASLLCGIWLERRLKRRWQLFREMQEVLLFLEKEMTYRRSPVPEALRAAAGRCRSELGELLSEAAKQTEQRRGKTFAAIWEEALNGCFPDNLLLEDERCLFRETAAALCGTDVVLQKTLLENYADRFRLKADAEALACHEKGGLYRKLAAAAGVFLVILLI